MLTDKRIQASPLSPFSLSKQMTHKRHYADNQPETHNAGGLGRKVIGGGGSKIVVVSRMEVKLGIRHDLERPIPSATNSIQTTSHITLLTLARTRYAE